MLKKKKTKKHTIFTDKTILGKMGGVYVTYVTNADKGQCHVETLVRSFDTKVQWQNSFLTSKQSLKSFGCRYS